MEGETKHPLLMPDILESIFNKLGVSDLKTCRQVNRQWHQEATLAMRSVVKVRFKSESEEPSGNGDKMQAFLELVQRELSTFSSLPFVNTFELHGVRLDYPEFWAFCGSSIKFLELDNISMDSPYIFRHIIFQSCPNLEELELSNFKVSGSPVEEPLAWVQPRFPQNMSLKRLRLYSSSHLSNISFVELLSYFPSLEEIFSYGEDTTDTSKIFQALATCREHDPLSWNIKSISFDIGSLKQPESDLPFLLDDNLSLETLVVEGVDKTEHVSLLKNILSTHATTLKHLRLDGDKTGEILGETMLEKLEHFSLFGAKITSLSFLHIMPNLKKLAFWSCTFSLESELSDEPLNHWLISSCTELTVYDRASIDLLKMFRRVPNVEKLHLLHCTNELFAGICEIFPSLVCLQLEDSKMNDCGISGLDEEDVKRINEDGSFGWFWWRPVTVPRPNLSSLKNLKWFQYGPMIPRENALGLCAALCGVQLLPQLQHLKIERYSLQRWNNLLDQYEWKDP